MGGVCLRITATGNDLGRVRRFGLVAGWTYVQPKETDVQSLHAEEIDTCFSGSDTEKQKQSKATKHLPFRVGGNGERKES